MKQYYASMRVFLLFIFCCCSFATYAQPASLDSSVTGGRGPASIIRDQFGNSYHLGELLINDTLRTQYTGTLIPLTRSTVAAGYYQLWLSPGSGMENFASDATHLRRLNVVSQVLSDLSAFINSSCSTNGQKINIRVMNPATISWPYGKHYLAAGMSFYSMPSDTGKSGIADNMIWTTIQSGNDAYTNFAPTLLANSASYGNGNTFFHGMLAIRFDSSGITFDTSLSSAPANSSNSYDLYTITLREIINALGFSSLIGSDGKSIFGAKQNYFSRYDLGVQTQAGTALLSHGSGSVMYNYHFNTALSTSILIPNSGSCQADSTDSTKAIMYKGGLTNPQAVYTPNCWEAGVSLGHFEDLYIANGGVSPSHQNNQYFLTSNVTNPGSMGGAMKRYPTAAERQVLADIGYSVNTIFGNSSHLNYINYGGSASTAMQVIGINDGIGSDGSYTFVTNSGTISIHGTDLLGNDIAVSGGSFEGLEVIGGDSVGTLSASSGTAGTSITFTAASGAKNGEQTLRYVPVSSTGVRGKTGTVSLLVNSPCPGSCANSIPCGDFENATYYDCGDIIGASMYYSNTILYCWNEFYWTPDLYSSGCINVPMNTGPAYTTASYQIPSNISTPSTGPHVGSPAGNYHFVGVWGSLFDSGAHAMAYGSNFVYATGPRQWLGEGLQERIDTLKGGNTYKMDLWAKVLNPSSNAALPFLANAGHIRFGLSKALLNVTWFQTIMPALPLQQIAPFYNNTSIWMPSQLDFTVPAPTTYPLLSNGQDSNWVHLTDTFTVPAGQNYAALFFYNDIFENPVNSSYPASYSNYIFVDDIRVQQYASFLANDTVCLGSAASFIANTGSMGSGSSFLWQLNAGPGWTNMVIYPPYTGIFSDTLHMSYTTSNMNGYQYRCIITNGAGCVDTTNAATLVLNQLPVMYTPLNDTACAGAGTSVSFNSISPSSGVTYTWTNSNTAIGLAASGSGFIGPFTAINTGTTFVTATITVTPHYALGTVSCPGTPVTFLIVVRPYPTVSNPGPYTPCNGVIVPAIIFSGTPGGVTFTWTNNNTAIGLGASGSGNIASFTATNMGSAPISATITVTPHANGCNGIPLSFTITVNPSPTVTLSAASTMCNGNKDTLRANTGSGITYVWEKNGIVIVGANGSSYIDSSSSGTYTVIETNSYGCTASASTIVNMLSETFCPCVIFNSVGAYTTVPAGTYFAAYFQAGHKYYINGNITIQTIAGGATIKKAYMLCDTNITITIDPAANLTLDSCHLFTGCNAYMWRGIRMYNVAGHSAKLYLSNTLIEDADTAVAIFNPVNATSGYTFAADSSIFNKDSIGLYIQGDTSNSVITYPFRIRASIFTSRSGIATSYSNWNSVAILEGSFSPLNPLTPPFNLNNTFPATPCNNTLPAYAGIVLNKVGNDARSSVQVGSPGLGGGCTITNYDKFFGMQIGDASQAYYRNMFDNLRYGIQATNANVTLLNSVVANANYGVFGNCSTSPAFYGQFQVINVNTISNQFWACSNSAVTLQNYYCMRGQQALMVGNQGPASGVNWGYNLSSNSYDTVDIYNNSIYNIGNGIAFSSVVNLPNGNNPCPTAPPKFRISWNTINRTYLTATGFVNQAISVQNSTSSLGSYTGIAGNAHIDHNFIDAYNGIMVNGFFKGPYPSSDSNEIKLFNNPASPAQYGIQHLNNNQNSIYFNNVYGADNTTKADTTNHIIRGIYSSVNSNIRVNCNYADSVGRGFEFAGTNTSTKWVLNKMQADLKGFVLNNAVIGKQWYKPLDSAIRCQWLGTNWNISGGPYQTFNIQSIDSNSKLWVYKNYPWTDPSVRYGNPNFGNWKYTVFPANIHGGIHEVMIGTSDSCAHMPPPSVAPSSIAPFEDVALNNITYGNNENVNDWLAQFSMYEALQTKAVFDNDDSTIIYTNYADSSLILQTFMDNAANSRYGYLDNIENYIASGDLRDAQTLLGTDLAAKPGSYTTPDGKSTVVITDYIDADYIVSDYKSFYQLVINYMSTALSSADSAQIISIASLCPLRDGPVVYKARALYAVVYNDLGTWNDDSTCNAVLGGGGGRKVLPGSQISATQTQEYNLYPNPNNGNITLLQKIIDENSVNTEVLNAEGQSVFKGELLFKQGITPLHLQNLSPGLYLVVLRDMEGKSYTLKFIVN